MLLNEAEANLIDNQKLLTLAQMEVKELRGRDKSIYEKFEKVTREVESLKAEINRLRGIERDYNHRKVRVLLSCVDIILYFFDFG